MRPDVEQYYTFSNRSRNLYGNVVIIVIDVMHG